MKHLRLSAANHLPASQSPGVFAEGNRLSSLGTNTEDQRSAQAPWLLYKLYDYNDANVCLSVGCASGLVAQIKHIHRQTRCDFERKMKARGDNCGFDCGRARARAFVWTERVAWWRQEEWMRFDPQTQTRAGVGEGGDTVRQRRRRASRHEAGAHERIFHNSSLRWCSETRAPQGAEYAPV